jgi:hypothetical protein
MDPVIPIDTDVAIIDDLERDIESFRTRSDRYDGKNHLLRCLRELESDTYYAVKKALSYQSYDEMIEDRYAAAKEESLALAAQQVQDAEDAEEQWRLEHERFVACAPVCHHCQTEIARMGEATVDHEGRLVHRPGTCPNDPSHVLTLSSLSPLAA